jgi:hypothetical protein
VQKIIINLGVAAYEQSNVVGERFSADDSKINEAFYCNRILQGSPEMPSGELIGRTLK